MRRRTCGTPITCCRWGIACKPPLSGRYRLSPLQEVSAAPGSGPHSPSGLRPSTSTL
ncbi:hypothetical protein AB205_0022920, partial [Aquarana catesbeiana]